MLMRMIRTQRLKYLRIDEAKSFFRILRIIQTNFQVKEIAIPILSLI